jgi:hypothetical protein
MKPMGSLVHLHLTGDRARERSTVRATEVSLQLFVRSVPKHIYVRFCERLGVKFSGPTRHISDGILCRIGRYCPFHLY